MIIETQLIWENKIDVPNHQPVILRIHEHLAMILLLKRETQNLFEQMPQAMIFRRGVGHIQRMAEQPTDALAVRV